MTEEEKRLTDRVALLRKMLSPFVCAIYNGQAHDWDHGAVFSMLTGNDNLKGDDLPARLNGRGREDLYRQAVCSTRIKNPHLNPD